MCIPLHACLGILKDKFHISIFLKFELYVTSFVCMCSSPYLNVIFYVKVISQLCLLDLETFEYVIISA